MPLVAEFDIGCEHLPFVGVAATVPDATFVLTLQFNHDELPLFFREGAGIPVPEQLPIWPQNVDFDLVETVIRENGCSRTELGRPVATPAQAREILGL